MGFNKSFEELDRSDISYFDQLVMEDTNLLGIIDAINVLTLPDQTKALVDMLALKTGDLTDGQPYGRIFWRAGGVSATKAELRRMARSGDLVVLRPTKYQPLQDEVKRVKTGYFRNGKDGFDVVRKSVIVRSLFELWKKDAYSNVDLYAKDSGVRKEGVLIMGTLREKFEAFLKRLSDISH